LFSDETGGRNENSATTKVDRTTPAVQEPQGFDPRQQKLESLRLDLKFGDLTISSSSDGSRDTECDTSKNSDSESGGFQDDMVKFDDWTILDCYFGIPLFDAAINQIVCEKMLTNGLWMPTSLEQLVKSNADLAVQLKAFIDTYQAPSSWNEDTPLPSKSFYCHNGRIVDFTL